MLRIGLTGGIGSGKSTVAALFAALGAPVIDTDQLAREIVEPGTPAWREIVAAFGAGVVGTDRRVRRAELRKRVFADAEARRRLEQITHPRIRELLETRISELDSPYCVIAIPLLVEGGGSNRVDRVAVVDVPEAVQRIRVMARDYLTAAEADAIMRAQASRAERLAVADDIIDNSGDRAHLRGQVERLHRQYLELAIAPVKHE